MHTVNLSVDQFSVEDFEFPTGCMLNLRSGTTVVTQQSQAGGTWEARPDIDPATVGEGTYEMLEAGIKTRGNVVPNEAQVRGWIKYEDRRGKRDEDSDDDDKAGV